LQFTINPFPFRMDNKGATLWQNGSHVLFKMHPSGWRLSWRY